MSIKIKLSPFLNCEETSKLISLTREEKISLWSKLQKRMHLSMCDACTKFENFVNKSGDIVQTPPPPEKMPKSIRDKIENK
ncbi:MAG: hypothetical protein ABUK01_18875 [Leptospirales bacterium]